MKNYLTKETGVGMRFILRSAAGVRNCKYYFMDTKFNTRVPTHGYIDDRKEAETILSELNSRHVLAETQPDRYSEQDVQSIIQAITLPPSRRNDVIQQRDPDYQED